MNFLTKLNPISTKFSLLLKQSDHLESHQEMFQCYFKGCGTTVEHQPRDQEAVGQILPGAGPFFLLLSFPSLAKRPFIVPQGRASLLANLCSCATWCVTASMFTHWVKKFNRLYCIAKHEFIRFTCFMP